ncbi:MAG: ferritin family protein [Bacteroidota bacterium]
MEHQGNDVVNWNEVSIEEILALAIADEEYARDYYKHAADLAGSLHTRQMLLQLSEMEQGHADQLRKELDELSLQRELEAGMAD